MEGKIWYNDGKPMGYIMALCNQYLTMACGIEEQKYWLLCYTPKGNRDHYKCIIINCIYPGYIIVKNSIVCKTIYIILKISLYT